MVDGKVKNTKYKARRAHYSFTTERFLVQDSSSSINPRLEEFALTTANISENNADLLGHSPADKTISVF